MIGSAYTTIHTGNYVMKTKGYQYPGVVVGEYKTLAGDKRYVVELAHTPLQHIFVPSQIRLATRDEIKQIDEIIESRDES